MFGGGSTPPTKERERERERERDFFGRRPIHTKSRRRRRHVASVRVSAGLPEEVLQEVRRRGGVAPETGGPDDRHPEREARRSDGEETHQRRRRRRRRRPTDSSERVRYQRFDGNDARTKDTREGTFVRSFVGARKKGRSGDLFFFLMCLLSSPGLFPNQREEGDLSSARRGSDI